MKILRSKMFGVETYGIIERINRLSKEELVKLIETSSEPAEIAAAQRRLRGTLPSTLEKFKNASIIVLGLHDKN